MALFRRRVREPQTGLEAIPLQFDCPASWKHMTGNDTVRHCTHCDRKVYNLSEMSQFEARTLFLREERHLCVRYHLRPDGKVMTRDCGRAVRARVKARVALASVLSILGMTLLPCMSVQGQTKTGALKVKLWEAQRLKRLARDAELEHKAPPSEP
jgi:hypothetical protein